MASATPGEEGDAPAAAGQAVLALTASDFLLLALCALALLSVLNAGAARLLGARRRAPQVGAHPKSA